MIILNKKTKLSAVIIACLCFALPGFAHASSVSLVPATDVTNLANGDIVSFDISIDSSSDVGTLGGGFDVIYDASALGFIGMTNAGLGDPAFGRDPDVTPGLLESWGVADFGGLQTGLVGSIDFTVLPSMGLSTLVALGPTAGIAGPWVSAVDFVSLLQPDYGSVEVSRQAPGVIPVPAAIWLFGTALLGLVGLGKRRSAA